jgi:hypothetical protein
MSPLCGASVTFSLIQQAFDNVWHQGLLFKLKTIVPSQIYLLLKSYLTDRHFQVKIENTYSAYHPIESGVLQGSVLGPFLYLIFTSDIPQSHEITLATFSETIAILSSHTNPNRASETLQLPKYSPSVVTTMEKQSEQ